MAHRRWLADLGLSVLLALPMGALAQPAPVTHQTSAATPRPAAALLGRRVPAARI